MNKNKIDKLSITFFVIMIIGEILSFAITKNIEYLNFSLLWFLVAIIKFTDKKIIEDKERNIIIQKKLNEHLRNYIENSDRMIDFEIIKLKDITIPKHFRKPKKEKIEERKKYFKNYKNFETSIILNDRNVLIDGYTTYLIAKENKLSHVYIKRVYKERNIKDE